MCNPQSRTLGETVNTWVQTLAIIAAGAWAVNTFVYKEIVLKSEEPAHVSIELKMEKIGYGTVGDDKYTAINLNVKVNNLSNRTVYLLPSFFHAFGIKLSPTEARNLGDLISKQEEMLKILNEELVKDADLLVPYQSIGTDATLLAVGQAFSNYIFEPNEHAERQIVLYVPKDEFDYIGVLASFPAMHKDVDIKAKWECLNQEDAVFSLERGQEDGTYIKINLENPSEEDEEYLKDIGYSFFDARHMVSLWTLSQKNNGN